MYKVFLVLITLAGVIPPTHLHGDLSNVGTWNLAKEKVVKDKFLCSRTLEVEQELKADFTMGDVGLWISERSPSKLYEGFEGDFPPLGWTVINRDGGSETWNKSPWQEHTGYYSAGVESESPTLRNDDWLITPRLVCYPETSDFLLFWYKAEHGDYPESLEVRLSTTTNEPDSFTVILWATTLTNTEWGVKTIGLDNYDNDSIYIAFVYKSLNKREFYIDDVYGPELLPIHDISTISISLVGADSLYVYPLSWMYWADGGSPIIVKACVKNTGTISEAPGIPLKLKITGPAGYLYEDIDQETQTTIEPDLIEPVTFSPSWTIPNTPLQTYIIKVWVELVGDANTVNDTALDSVTVTFYDSLKVHTMGEITLNTLWCGVTNLSVSNSYVYICADELYAVDIVDPINPFLTGSYYIDWITYAEDVYLVGNYGYVAESWAATARGRLRVYDISNPYSLQQLGKSGTVSDDAHAVCVAGDWAYLACDNHGVYVMSVSDPTQPGAVTIQYDTEGEANDIFLLYNYAYVAVDPDGLLILDVSNPLSITLVGSCTEPANAQAVYVSGNYAYVADGVYGLRIIDVSNPANPYLKATLNTPGYAQRVYVINNLAYIADSDSGLRIIDVSEPTTPREVGYYVCVPWCVTSDVFVSGNRICVVTRKPATLYMFEYQETIGITERPPFSASTGFALSQNIPNPFTSTTDVSYLLPVESDVSLKIYDVSGELIRTLVSDREQVGYYTVSWDGRDDNGQKVAPGVYFYKLATNKCSSTKKMILVQ